MRISRIIAAAAILTILAVSAAAEAPSVEYRSVRSLGMGGVGLTTLGTFEGMIYNPAQLARAGFSFDVASVSVSTGRSTVDLVRFVDDHQDELTDYLELPLYRQIELYNDLQEWNGTWLGAKANANIGITFNGIGIGAYATGDLDYRAVQPIPFIEPQLHAHGRVDRVFTAGAAFRLPTSWSMRLLPNPVYMGIGGKLISRYETTEILDPEDYDYQASLDNLEESKTTGWSADLGLLYELMPGRVEVGFDIDNALSSIDGEGMPRIFNLGAHWRLNRNLILAADLNDMFGHYDTDLNKRFNLGAELELLGLLFVRGGYGRGNASMGLGLDLAIVEIDAASYQFDSRGQDGDDGKRQYAAQIRIRI
jgi:hypothetical protein